MLVTYGQIVAADCTSDPHPVYYGDFTDPAILHAMFTDIIRVLESDMIMGVRSVRATYDGQEYDSDVYEDAGSFVQHDAPVASGPEAEKHRIAGFVFYSDSHVDKSRHLPPGLTGVKELFRMVQQDSKKFESLSIGVTWTFAGQSSCSDYITCGGEDNNTVDYGSQDWYITRPSYLAWCARMEEFLGKAFPHAC
jgi:hypothetical protein